MPSPSTKGNPRDWQVYSQGPEHAADFRRRAKLNETKPCRCPGCTKTRAGVSRYCDKHRDLASDRGDPTSRLPKRNELLIFKHAIKVMLATDATLAKRIVVELDSLERTMSLPASFRMGPADLHRGLPQVAKAVALRAVYQHSGGTYTDAVIHALALDGWMRVYFDGAPENRRRFLRVRAGTLMGEAFRNPRAKHAYPVSGAVRHRIGSDLVKHAHAIFGASFWDTPVHTKDGQDMTLLAYTRLALKAAGLLLRAPTAR